MNLRQVATIPFDPDLFSAALVEQAKSIPVHSLILSFHLFFCLPLFLFTFTVPCRIVFAKPEDLETWPNHLSFRFLTRIWHASYIKGLFEISEDMIQILLMLAVLSTQDSEVGDWFYGAPSGFEPGLFFSNYLFSLRFISLFKMTFSMSLFK